MDFIVRIADLNIRISCFYPQTKTFCKNYLVDMEYEKADFSIVISKQDIDFEREKSMRENQKTGISIPYFSDSYLETLAVYRKIANRIIEYNTVLFHGSAIAVDGAGYLFTAKSGTGKSTHTKLWREKFGERTIMVNDDKPLLKVVDKEVLVYGTPWDGKHRLSNNISVPLKAICVLERADVNRIKAVSSKEILPTMLQQSYRPQNSLKMEKTLQIIDRILENTVQYRLGCNMDIQSAEIAYHMMSKDGKDEIL